MYLSVAVYGSPYRLCIALLCDEKELNAPPTNFNLGIKPLDYRVAVLNITSIDGETSGTIPVLIHNTQVMTTVGT